MLADKKNRKLVSGRNEFPGDGFGDDEPGMDLISRFKLPEHP
jgi:hypothetical protein